MKDTTEYKKIFDQYGGMMRTERASGREYPVPATAKTD